MRRCHCIRNQASVVDRKTMHVHLAVSCLCFPSSLGDHPDKSPVHPSGPLIEGSTARCLVAIDVLGTVHLFAPVQTENAAFTMQEVALRRVPANLQHAAVADVRGGPHPRPSIVVATGDGILFALDPVLVQSEADSARNLTTPGAQQIVTQKGSSDSASKGHAGHVTQPHTLLPPPARGFAISAGSLEAERGAERDAAAEAGRGAAAGGAWGGARVALRVSYGCNVGALIADMCPLALAHGRRPQFAVACPGTPQVAAPTRTHARECASCTPHVHLPYTPHVHLIYT